MKQKLTREDYKALCTKALEGNDNAFETLYKHTHTLIQYIASKYFVNGNSVEDLEQELLINLRYKVITNYDPERGNFNSFCALSFNRHLQTLIIRDKTNYNIMNTKAFQLEDGDIGSNSKEPLQVMIDDEELLELDNKFKKHLTTLELKVYECFKYYKYSEIATVLHITLKQVDNALLRMRDKLHEHYGYIKHHKGNKNKFANKKDMKKYLWQKYLDNE